jgi:hypothetical protein
MRVENTRREFDQDTYDLKTTAAPPKKNQPLPEYAEGSRALTRGASLPVTADLVTASASIAHGARVFLASIKPGCEATLKAEIGVLSADIAALKPGLNKLKDDLKTLAPLLGKAAWEELKCLKDMADMYEGIKKFEECVSKGDTLGAGAQGVKIAYALVKLGHEDVPGLVKACKAVGPAGQKVIDDLRALAPHMAKLGHDLARASEHSARACLL